MTEPTTTTGALHIPLDRLPDHVGRTLGPTDWLTVEQARIDGFADATGDDQWIHVDPVRAAASPFGGTIAHGYLTLALSSYFLPQLFVVDEAGMAINYGLDRVRFPSPVRSGSRVRCEAHLAAVDPVTGGFQLRTRATLSVDGADRPACVAELLTRYLAPSE
ncbi:MaoC family dehydratase [Pseudonocardia ailaonensis]|uniref:MaoC family dehydratase n=1 Tax=Pseudonocardia ailaonensis TaxID=367279 RepID=A0ABN2MJ59_9PSEU